jgi:tRNA(Arg) A34 adenosine deaminase TadA
MAENKEDSAAYISQTHLQGLLHVASLTNTELFPIVVATINKYTRSTQPKQKGKKENSSWKDIALRVAIDVAKGQEKCCCQDCWIERYRQLSSNESSGEKLSFADALKSLNCEECSKKRLQNALDAICALESSDITTHVSIQQVVGLIRISTHLQGLNDSTSLQVRALSCLLKLMPQVKNHATNDIFLAVQQPILQRLSWDVLIQSGIKFASQESENDFRALLGTSIETEAEGDTDVNHAGVKRKRGDENNTRSVDDGNRTIIHYILEAAHLARKGVVRAKHGAVIYIPTSQGTQQQVIGRGWNHDYIQNKNTKTNQKNKLNLHSEVHAVANAIQTYGEDACFEDLFPKATIVIVELSSDYGYETSHPCPKCDPMLRAVGIPKVIHSTPDGKVVELDLGEGNIEFLKNENVKVALGAACSELNVVCKRLGGE